MGHMSLSVGRLLCRPLRDHLNQEKFMGYKIDFIESKGMFERTFVIRGDDNDLVRIKGNIDRWSREMEKTA